MPSYLFLQEICKLGGIGSIISLLHIAKEEELKACLWAHI